MYLRAMDRTLVLAVMDVPAVPVTGAMMARASTTMLPVVDGRTSVMGVLGGRRRARPDGGRGGENARNE
jgi:hypothetical protein